MKIYQLALARGHAQDVTQNAKKRPFDKIFGDNQTLRFAIPLQNQALMDLVKRLENGETKTKLKYKVDIQNSVAYRYVKNELDPRAMRLGKVIMKELGQAAANEWSQQASSSQSNDYTIVVSRSPIDIARMSDYGGIHYFASGNPDIFSVWEVSELLYPLLSFL